MLADLSMPTLYQVRRFKTFLDCQILSGTPDPVKNGVKGKMGLFRVFASHFRGII